MGNQASKDAAAGSSKSTGNNERSPSDALQSYPSFSRSDTKDSSRSLLPVDFEDPAAASLDAWLPIVSQYQNVKAALRRRR